MMIYGYIGEEKREIMMEITQNSSFSLINKNYYNPKDSKSSKIISSKLLNINNYPYEVDEVSDQIILKDIKQNEKEEFQFFLGKKVNNQFALAHHIDNKNQSIVYYLKKIGVIDSAEYGFGMRSWEIGSIYFGSIPNSFINDGFIYNCNADNSIVQWACQLKATFVNNKKYPLKGKTFASFQMNLDKMILPYDLFHFIVDNIFREHINNQICNIEENNHDEYLKCKRHINNILQEKENSIIFSFGNEFNLNISFIKMLTCKKEECESLFKSNNYEMKDKMVLNRVILSITDIIMFNYETNSIHFYSYRNLGMTEIDVLNVNKKYILFFLISLLLSACFMLIQVKYNGIFNNINLKEVYY